MSRKVHFLQFCADFSKKPKSVKAIYIFHPKVFTTFFQKIIWFKGIWPILYELLAIKKCWLSRNLTKLFDKWQLDKWPHFSSTFYALIVRNIHFWIWKNSKFMSRLWSILACKIPQFLARSYRFGQLIIFFQKVDTLRLLKIYYILSTCHSQILIFLGFS